MSEADKLWREAMEAFASQLDAIPREILGPLAVGWLATIASFARMMERPAGWGEGGKDE